ncbi:hypothetical protein DFJ73DRAFT_18522 [Zopfochytrium polystomum]|nr:hypothetical protein DFJ73DRAFT_18522 [Zopfochytrium polystomum]
MLGGHSPPLPPFAALPPQPSAIFGDGDGARVGGAIPGSPARRPSDLTLAIDDDPTTALPTTSSSAAVVADSAAAASAVSPPPSLPKETTTRSKRISASATDVGIGGGNIDVTATAHPPPQYGRSPTSAPASFLPSPSMQSLAVPADLTKPSAGDGRAAHASLPPLTPPSVTAPDAAAQSLLLLNVPPGAPLLDPKHDEDINPSKPSPSPHPRSRSASLFSVHQAPMPSAPSTPLGLPVETPSTSPMYRRGSRQSVPFGRAPVGGTSSHRVDSPVPPAIPQSMYVLLQAASASASSAEVPGSNGREPVSALPFQGSTYREPMVVDARDTAVHLRPQPIFQNFGAPTNLEANNRTSQLPSPALSTHALIGYVGNGNGAPRYGSMFAGGGPTAPSYRPYGGGHSSYQQQATQGSLSSSSNPAGSTSQAVSQGRAGGGAGTGTSAGGGQGLLSLSSANSSQRVSDGAEHLQIPPKMVLDQSVATGLLDHMFSDPSFEVIGYLGGLQRRVRDFLPGYGRNKPTDIVVCHVTHFFPCSRSMPGFLTAWA